MTYAVSVIRDRAIPRIEDGLKPVQRRILYAMKKMGLSSSGHYRKSAGIIGEVLGKYHPHGDQAVYEAMVNMTQDFRMRYPMVDGHGNFGSLDNDPPAAMRYTEARLTPYAESMMEYLEDFSSGFVETFDGNNHEPEFFPVAVPNIFLNGSNGIAVGMSTSILPHNLTEIMKACIAMIHDPHIDVSGILEYVKGPDFPLGAIVLLDNAETVYQDGKGSMKIRSTMHIEGKNIVITDLPYLVDRASVIHQITDMVCRQNFEKILDIRDESNRDGIRIVVETDGDVQIVVDRLYAGTKLQTTVHMRNLVLLDGKPEIVGIRKMIQFFIDYRKSVLKNRMKKEYENLKKRDHILDAIVFTLENPEFVLKTVRSSETLKKVIKNLNEKCSFSEIQAKAILDMSWRKLIKMEYELCQKEKSGIEKRMNIITDIFENSKKMDRTVIEDFRKYMEKLGNPRRTRIVRCFDEAVPSERKIVLYATCRNYIGTGLFEGKNDLEKFLFETDSHVFVWTSFGRVFSVDVSKIGNGHVSDILGFSEKEKIVHISDSIEKDMCLVTKKGKLACIRTRKKEFQAMKLVSGDSIVSVFDKTDKVICITRFGMGSLVDISNAIVKNPPVVGIDLVRLKNRDLVWNASDKKKYIIIVTIKGFVKILDVNDLPEMSRRVFGSRVLDMDQEDRVYRVFEYGKQIFYLLENKKKQLCYNNIPFSGRKGKLHSLVSSSFSCMISI
jgi:DNA gyrase subunit A